MDTAIQIRARTSLQLDLPPSCVQFSPGHRDHVVVGTYSLQQQEGDNAAASINAQDPEQGRMPTVKKAQSRNGSLLVIRIASDGSAHILQTYLQPSALLDLRFHPATEDCQGIIASVSSTGNLAIFQLNLNMVQASAAPLQLLATSRCDDLAEDVLFLQCNWHPTIRNVIGVTTSTGLARLLVLDDKWRISRFMDINIANSLEAWSIAFSCPFSKSSSEDDIVSVYCGGDDSLLRYTSVSFNSAELLDISSQAQLTVSGRHDAGVTAILPLSLLDEDGCRLVVTGSYDDQVRLLAIHDVSLLPSSIKRVKELVRMNVGGGVWRLSLVDITRSGSKITFSLMASCMHAGVRMMKMQKIAGCTWTCEVTGYFQEHESMNYASDFCRDSKNSNLIKCVSTSFYDRLFCVWDWELDAQQESQFEAQN